MADKVHYVKVRMPGKNQYLFLTSKGGLNHLRIHAARFDDKAKAQAVVDVNKDDPENTGVSWKVV
jgi:hypothetical protein